MRSNSFGSMQQSIVIHVPVEQAPTLAKVLGLKPFKLEGEPPRSYFTWHRWTTRTGDDEDVVVHLWGLIGDPRDEVDWKVDWDASEY
ncbi:hypothetical protein GCM10019059_43830 [Camelimonas fluminis]|nr:hypothetical protein GCM10019059_43830 [Camelimonas fluminis]